MNKLKLLSQMYKVVFLVLIDCIVLRRLYLWSCSGTTRLTTRLTGATEQQIAIISEWQSTASKYFIYNFVL